MDAIDRHLQMLHVLSKPEQNIYVLLMYVDLNRILAYFDKLSGALEVG